MNAANLVDGAGRSVVLGKQLGTGGEGSVYEVAGFTNLVAKIYHKPPPAERTEKLRALAQKLPVMLGLATSQLCKYAAWPKALVFERPGVSLVGLMMEKVEDYKEVHTLYSPAQRKQTFAHADWKFLAHVAANCAAAFHHLHEHGVVVGDVNQSNVMIHQDGSVKLIDCDSFQVQSAGRIYPCQVGVPLFTPPELHGRSFRGVTRTADHDRFGLAVLVFHLLMMGRHPFSGRYGGAGDMPIERAIQEFRFAYGRTAATVQMQPPLHALQLSALSPQLGTLFERAFGAQSPKGRPAAAEWHAALTGFRDSLRPCPRDTGHKTPVHISGCVWCDLMKQGAPNFFVSVAFAAAIGAKPAQAFALAAVWGRIDAVPRPVLGYMRPARSLSVAPTPWPAGIPTVVPPKPAAPTILTTAHVPPDPVLPPRRCAKCVLPYSPTQRLAGYVALALVAFSLPCGLLGPAIGRAVTGNQLLSGGVLLGVFAMLILGVAAWWGALEWKRREEQAVENREYEEEQRERRRLAREQLEAWEEKLNAAVGAAQREYDERVREWDQRVSSARKEAERRRGAARAAAQDVAVAERNWANRATALTGEFDKKKAELAALRDSHGDLLRRLAVDQQQLLARAQEFQRIGFLQQQFIDAAIIPDIGPTRKATLASFGIESAYDLTEGEIRAIPGFGEKLTARLLDWRADVESRFRFNPAIGVPEQERRALEFRYFQLRQPVEARLTGGERELSEIVRRAQAELENFRLQMQPLLVVMDRNTADLASIPQGL